MASPDAATLRADPEAAAEHPADDAGADEHYMQLLSTPGSYASGQAEQQQQTLQQVTQQWMEQAQQQQQTFQQQAQQQQQSFQQMVQESMNTYMQMFNIPHAYLQEGMRLAQQDTPATPQERSRGGDPKEDQYRRSAEQSS